MSKNIKIAQAIIQLVIACVTLVAAFGLLDIDAQELAALVGFSAAATGAAAGQQARNGG